MSRFIKKQGFTLIELMVVIVIIGVLASLAIPRFTEASVKAKVAEAPRVLASYESAALAAAAEGGDLKTDLIFDLPTSKWWSYTSYGNATSGSANAVAQAGVGITATLTITVSNNGDVTRSYTGHTKLSKMIPNFKTN